MSKQFTPETTVALGRYPIVDVQDPSRTAVIERYRNDLDQTQYCVLPGFVQPAALAAMVGEANALHPHAYHNRSHRNCYLQREPDPKLPPDHPRNYFFDASYRMIANDLWAEDSLLTGLYHWPPFAAFVAHVVGVEKLYPSADPYQPVNVLCYGEGDRSAWHFDSSNAFTLTLMLQAAESGGEFEIVPDIRSDTDPNVDGLGAVLRGDRTRVITVPREPGALVIFRGCDSVHRVTPVVGSTERLMAVLVYESSPGVIGDPEVNATVYGPRTRT